MAEFTGPYQDIYSAARARLRESEARQRGGALARSARQGVMTSGVSQIPQDAISREAIMSEQDLGARIAGQQEQERLADKRFGQQKELVQMQADLQAAAEARARKLAKQQGRSALMGQLGGAVIGGVGGYLANRYGMQGAIRDYFEG